MSWPLFLQMLLQDWFKRICVFTMTSHKGWTGVSWARPNGANWAMAQLAPYTLNQSIYAFVVKDNAIDLQIFRKVILKFALILMFIYPRQDKMWYRLYSFIVYTNYSLCNPELKIIESDSGCLNYFWNNLCLYIYLKTLAIFVFLNHLPL